MKGLLLTIIIMGLINIQYVNGQGSISGPTQVCGVGSTADFTVLGSSATSGYSWSVSTSGAGITLLSGQGTNKVTLKFTTPGPNKIIQVSGNGLSVTTAVQVDLPPAQPLPISGPITVCAGGTADFNTTIPSSLTQVSWVVPSSASVLSQDGLSQAHALIRFPVNFTNGQIIVYGINGSCGSGPVTTLNVTAGGPPPAAPGTISGNSVVGSGQLGVAYSVLPIDHATSYKWSIPAGANIASGLGTKDITIDFPSPFTGGTVTVRGANATCDGPVSTPFAITPPPSPPTRPADAGVMTLAGGVNAVCVNNVSTTTMSVSVDPEIDRVTSYNWSFSDPNIVPLGNTNSRSIVIQISPNITVNVATISVYGSNVSGNGAPSSITFQINRPVVSTGAIAGLSSICPGQTSTSYQIDKPINAVDYRWTPPVGASITSKNSTNTTVSATVDFSSSYVGGVLTVTPTAGVCGDGPSSTLPITPKPIPAAASGITGGSPVCQGQMGIPYFVPSITNALEYVWTLPDGTQKITTTPQVNTDFSVTAVNGQVSVYGRNTTCTGASSFFPVTVNTTAVITIQPYNTDYTLGNKTFVTQATGTNLAYQWRKNNSDIPGANGATFIINHYRVSDVGLYDVVIRSNGICPITSNTTTFSIKKVEDQQDKNYIISRAITKDGVYNESDIAGLTSDEMQMSIVYFDGLGRPVQQVNWQNGPSKADVVQPIFYDQFNRESRHYLPLPTQQDWGWYKPIEYDATGNYSGADNNVYSNNPNGKIAQDTRPFSETIFEVSPVDNPLKEYGAGANWKTQDKFIEHSIHTNVDGNTAGQEKIIAWTIDIASGLPIANTSVMGTTSGAGYYPTGMLHIKSTKDEQGNEVREYVDKLGKVILKKVQAIAAADLNNPNQWALTYYIYDDFGHLVMVLPPEAVNTLTN